MNEREVLADLIRIMGNVNSRVIQSEGDLKKMEETIQALIKEVSTLKEMQYTVFEQTYTLHEK